MSPGPGRWSKPSLSKCRGTNNRRFRRRNTREENAQLKAGEVPPDWDEPKAKTKRRQKDTDARWTKKNQGRHYDYLCPLGTKTISPTEVALGDADQQHELIQSYAVTTASVDDSQVFDELIDQTIDKDGNKRTVYADSAYRSGAQEQKLVDARIDNQICEKGVRGKPLTEAQKAPNRTK